RLRSTGLQHAVQPRPQPLEHRPLVPERRQPPLRRLETTTRVTAPIRTRHLQLPLQHALLLQTPQRRIQRTPRHPPPHLPLQVARDLRAVPITPQLEHDEQDYLLELSETRVTHRPSECVWN